MRISAIIFLGYILSLLIICLSGLNNIFTHEASSRVIFFCSVLPAILFLLKTNLSSLSVRRCFCIQRFRYKCIGFFALLLVMAAYGAAMSNWGFYPFPLFVSDLPLLFIAVLTILPLYIAWADTKLENTKDGYYLLGMVLAGKSRLEEVDIKQFLLSWLVKILFIPIMYGALIESLSALLGRALFFDPTYFVVTLFLFGLSFDLIIATAGYFFSTSFLKNQLISTDSNVWGWVVCLVCYAPFLVLMQYTRELADYTSWTNWLDKDQWLYWVWAFLITITWFGYWVSTACFGLRFSNLSWRGLVNWGPYRYVKHPAYLSKNLYWWLHAVPFIGFTSFSDLLLKVFVLVGISGIYYLRAKTEERHLMKFPEYAGYSAYIAHNGLLARIKKICRLQAI